MGPRARGTREADAPAAVSREQLDGPTAAREKSSTQLVDLKELQTKISVSTNCVLERREGAWGLDQLGANFLGGVDQVAQGLFGLCVAAGLQATVRVDPELAGRDVLDGGAEQFGDLGLAGDAGAVDVVDARAYAAAKAVGFEIVDNVHAGAGGLNGGHVGIQAVNGVDDDTKFGVAQVGVDLGAVDGTGRGEAEGVHGPVQVRSLVGACAGAAVRAGRAHPPG